MPALDCNFLFFASSIETTFHRLPEWNSFAGGNIVASWMVQSVRYVLGGPLAPRSVLGAFIVALLLQMFKLQIEVLIASRTLQHIYIYIAFKNTKNTHQSWAQNKNSRFHGHPTVQGRSAHFAICWLAAALSCHSYWMFAIVYCLTLPWTTNHSSLQGHNCAEVAGPCLANRMRSLQLEP